jgi:hypothetical protein
MGRLSGNQQSLHPRRAGLLFARQCKDGKTQPRLPHRILTLLRMLNTRFMTHNCLLSASYCDTGLLNGRHCVCFESTPRRQGTLSPTAYIIVWPHYPQPYPNRSIISPLH